MQKLLHEIRQCQICLLHLEQGVNPVLAASPNSRIAIIGQAPGRIVHQSGIPWDDKSGERLRDWMGITPRTFYNEELIAIVPMGFCYPGTGKTGDLPPRPECAPQWHQPLWQNMPQLELVLLIGAYAQNYYLPQQRKESLTARVQNFREYLPKYLVLPHPSPRNNIWMKKNPWFAEEVLPHLKQRVQSLIRE